jgi:predicted nucleic acid-binding protein
MSWLLVDGTASARRYASAVLEAMKDPALVAQVPVTWGLEVANVIARAEARGIIREAQSEAFLEMLAALRVRPDAAMFSRALTDTLDLGRRHRLSSYDASYLELALRSGLPIATLDDDLLRATRKAGTRRFDP